MSNWHGQLAGKNVKSIMVVFHIPVPDEELNSGGDDGSSVHFRTAVFEHKQVGGVVHSALYNLATKDATEYGKLQSGELVEIVKEVVFTSADDDLIRKRGEVDAVFTGLRGSMEGGIDNLRNDLKFWNFQRNVT